MTQPQVYVCPLPPSFLPIPPLSVVTEHLTWALHHRANFHELSLLYMVIYMFPCCLSNIPPSLAPTMSKSLCSMSAFPLLTACFKGWRSLSRVISSRHPSLCGLWTQGRLRYDLCFLGPCDWESCWRERCFLTGEAAFLLWALLRCSIPVSRGDTVSIYVW